MGMYDYVTCEMPLPGDDPPGSVFQTKDTPAQWMERYTIRADGRLVHHAVDYVEVPREERPYPDATGILGMAGALRSVPKGDVVVEDLHQDLRFYRGWKVGDRHAFREYVARFTDGVCVGISGPVES